MNIVDRIFQLVDAKYKEQREFAADLGLKPSVISAWRCGRSVSYSKYIPQIASVLDTSAEYLWTGEKEQPTDKVGELKGQALDLIEELNTLDPAEFAQVKDFVSFLRAKRSK